MSQTYYTGNTPTTTDTLRVLETKILNNLGALSQGTGQPSFTPTTANAIYLDIATGNLYAWNNTGKAWKANGA